MVVDGKLLYAAEGHGLDRGADHNPCIQRGMMAYRGPKTAEVGSVRIKEGV